MGDLAYERKRSGLKRPRIDNSEEEDGLLSDEEDDMNRPVVGEAKEKRKEYERRRRENLTSAFDDLKSVLTTHYGAKNLYSRSAIVKEATSCLLLLKDKATVDPKQNQLMRNISEIPGLKKLITYVEELKTKVEENSGDRSSSQDQPDGSESSRQAQPTFVPHGQGMSTDGQIYRQTGYSIGANYGRKLDQNNNGGYSIPTNPDPAVINQMLQNPYFLQTSLPSHLILKPNDKLFLDPPQQQATPTSTRSQQSHNNQTWQHPQAAMNSNYGMSYNANNAASNQNGASPPRNNPNNGNAASNGNTSGNGTAQYENSQGMVEYSRFLMGIFVFMGLFHQAYNFLSFGTGSHSTAQTSNVRSLQSIGSDMTTHANNWSTKLMYYLWFILAFIQFASQSSEVTMLFYVLLLYCILGATIGSRYPILSNRIWKRVNKLEKVADECEDEEQRVALLKEAFVLTGGKWPESSFDAVLYCIWHSLRIIAQTCYIGLLAEKMTLRQGGKAALCKRFQLLSKIGLPKKENSKPATTKLEQWYCRLKMASSVRLLSAEQRTNMSNVALV